MYYEYVDSDGNEYSRNKTMTAAAREGKTKLQREALEATKAEHLRFESREQHKEFMAFEDLASPIDRTENGKKWLAWMQVCIRNASALNRRVRNVSMDNLLSNFANKSKMDAWWNALDEKAKNEILGKKNQPVKVEGLKPASALPRPAYVKKAPDHINDIIAKFEALSGCNIRVTASAKEHARLIHEDGRDIETFIQWAKDHEWYSEHLDVFKSLAKVWEVWPKAFEVQGEVW